jgi:hypothetical protein
MIGTRLHRVSCLIRFGVTSLQFLHFLEFVEVTVAVYSIVSVIFTTHVHSVRFEISN